MCQSRAACVTGIVSIALRRCETTVIEVLLGPTANRPNAGRVAVAVDV